MELSKKREEGRSREMEKECATRLVGEVKRKKKILSILFPHFSKFSFNYEHMRALKMCEKKLQIINNILFDRKEVVSVKYFKQENLLFKYH